MSDTLFESFELTDPIPSTDWAGGAKWAGQTFTPSGSHNLTSIKFYLQKVGSPGSASVHITATDVNGLPTGADLVSATFDGDALTTSLAWVEITLSATSLTSGTKYAAYIKALSGDISNYVGIALQTSSYATYSGGTEIATTDSGASWTAYTPPSQERDSLFMEYGIPLAGEAKGAIAIYQTQFRYLDAYGVERYLEGTVV